jgi:ribulose 1,5-bisphosphate carboxylase large subunit-like protein
MSGLIREKQQCELPQDWQPILPVVQRVSGGLHNARAAETWHSFPEPKP